MILSFSFIIFHYKIYIEKIKNSPLYTLVQNLTFLKKANDFMRNSARMTNNGSNNRCFFALFSCNKNFKLLL